MFSVSIFRIMTVVKFHTVVKVVLLIMCCLSNYVTWTKWRVGYFIYTELIRHIVRNSERSAEKNERVLIKTFWSIRIHKYWITDLKAYMYLESILYHGLSGFRKHGPFQFFLLTCPFSIFLLRSLMVD